MAGGVVLGLKFTPSLPLLPAVKNGVLVLVLALLVFGGEGRAEDVGLRVLSNYFSFSALVCFAVPSFSVKRMLVTLNQTAP